MTPACRLRLRAPRYAEDFPDRFAANTTDNGVRLPISPMVPDHATHSRLFVRLVTRRGDEFGQLHATVEIVNADHARVVARGQSADLGVVCQGVQRLASAGEAAPGLLLVERVFSDG